MSVSAVSGVHQTPPGCRHPSRVLLSHSCPGISTTLGFYLLQECQTSGTVLPCLGELCFEGIHSIATEFEKDSASNLHPSFILTLTLHTRALTTPDSTFTYPPTQDFYFFKSFQNESEHWSCSITVESLSFEITTAHDGRRDLRRSGTLRELSTGTRQFYKYCCGTPLMENDFFLLWDLIEDV